MNLTRPDNTEVVEVAEATRRLNVSVEALRKRIARGKQPGTKRDGRYYAFLAPDTRLTTPDTSEEPRRGFWRRLFGG